MPSFFVYDPPPSAIYTLSLHDALPILLEGVPVTVRAMDEGTLFGPYQPVLTLDGTYVEWARYETALLGLICQASGDRKSTRLNSSHTVISYAVFCLKKKKKEKVTIAVN